MTMKTANNEKNNKIVNDNENDNEK